MRRLTANPWIVCLSAASFFFFQYIQLTIFNTVKSELMLAFNATAASLSLLASIYFYGTIIFTIPAGILLDYLSTRTIILLAIILSLFGLAIFTFTDSILIAGIGRFIIGVSGGPVCFLGTMRIASRWFPPERFAFVTGVIVAMAMLGGIIAQTPFTYLISAVGWQNAMYINLGLGVAITCLIYLFVYDCPAGKEREYQEQVAYYRKLGFVNGLKAVMLKGQNWYCGLFAALVNLPIFVFGALIGSLYLTQIFAFSKLEASYICSGLFLGMLIGGPVFGYISDKLHLRKVPMLIGLIICLVAVAYVIRTSNTYCCTHIFAFFMIGFGCSAHILVYPTISESNLPALTGSALSLASVLLMSSGAIFLPLIGWLLECAWDKTIIDGLPIYNITNYRMALWSLPICLTIAAGLWLAIRETYCRNRNV